MMVSRYHPSQFDARSVLQTRTGSARRMACDTERVTGESDMTIYKGLGIQVEGIQLAANDKSPGTATKPTLSFSLLSLPWLP